MPSSAPICRNELWTVDHFPEPPCDGPSATSNTPAPTPITGCSRMSLSAACHTGQRAPHTPEASYHPGELVEWSSPPQIVAMPVQYYFEPKAPMIRTQAKTAATAVSRRRDDAVTRTRD